MMSENKISDMHKLPITSLILSAVSFAANCLYFYIEETENKCFLQELPSETLFVGHYKCNLYDTEQRTILKNVINVGMHIDVHDPDNKLVFLRWYSAEGRFSFVSHTPGVHKICLHSNSAKQHTGRKLRIYLNFQTGEHAVNYTGIQKSQNLTDLEIKFRKLIDQAADIAKEHDYQRYREEMFRGTTESISMQVLLWSIAQTVLLIIMGTWQMLKLRIFLEAKKLV